MSRTKLRFDSLFRRGASALLFGGLVAAAAPALADDAFSYANFSDLSGLGVNGNAAGTLDGAQSVLRITPAIANQSGSAFRAVNMSGDYSFSTMFDFRLHGGAGGPDVTGDPLGADGMLFVLHQDTRGTAARGEPGGNMGFFAAATNVTTPRITPALAIEFDTWEAGIFDVPFNVDTNGNHVGINVLGANPYLSSFSLAQTPSLSATPLSLNNGTRHFAWVDYDGSTKELSVYLANDSDKPASPLLSRTLPLDQIFSGNTVYAGFTAGTGGATNNHDLWSWNFSTAPSSMPPSPPVPPPFTPVNVALPNFADPGAIDFQLNGNAAFVGDRLRVVPSVNNQRGTAYLRDPMTLPEGSTFSAQFAFQMTNGFTTEGAPNGDVPGADGLMFVLQSQDEFALGTLGAGVGLFGTRGGFLAVEFDTWSSGSFDPAGVPATGNHLGINASGFSGINGSGAQVRVPMAAPFLWNDGQTHFAWVEYDGTNLNVFVANEDLKPLVPMATMPIDLDLIFNDINGRNIWAGFTSGTGGARNDTDVLSFQMQVVPEPSSIALCGVALVGLMGYGVRRRRTG